jgi:putative Mg2+ transporter-C (MgtC) family protein
MDVVLSPRQKIEALYEAIMSVDGIKRVDVN